MIEFQRLTKSFYHAFKGVQFAFVHNQNFRIHLVIGSLVVLASIFFRVSPFEMSILGVMILLVLSAEMINSAIEEMVNFVVTEHKREAKIAKDVAAGMVLITTLGSVIVGFLVFIPHVVLFIQQISGY